jgi:hypothetical protein
MHVRYEKDIDNWVQPETDGNNETELQTKERSLHVLLVVSLTAATAYCRDTLV